MSHIANISKAKQRALRKKNEYKQILIEYGLWKSSRINTNTSDPKSLLKRYQQIDKYVSERDSSVSSLHNLTSKFAKNAIDNDPSLRLEVKHDFLKQFVREHNTLTRNLDDDHEYTARIFFNGILHGWTNRDYDIFNRVVKCLFIFCLCIVLFMFTLCFVCFELVFMCSSLLILYVIR